MVVVEKTSDGTTTGINKYIITATESVRIDVPVTRSVDKTMTFSENLPIADTHYKHRERILKFPYGARWKGNIKVWKDNNNDWTYGPYSYYKILVSEPLSILSSFKTDYFVGIKIHENISLHDYHKLSSCINFADNMFVADECQKHIKPIFKEDNISFEDYTLDNCNTVISDIIISENPFDITTPSGYSSWNRLISGDYCYKDALVKCCIQSKGSENRAVLKEYKLMVDLPDIQDHNVAKLNAENTWIPFELEFYKVPEVTVTGVGSTEFAVPNITKVDLLGFYVELKTADGKLTSGIISWQALGF